MIETVGFSSSSFLPHSTKKLLEIINELSKVTKSIHRKSTAFLNTNHEPSERGRKQTKAIYNSIKKNKIPRRNLTKDVKDPHTENFKALVKKLKTQINGKISRAHGTQEFILLKCPRFPKQCTQ